MRRIIQDRELERLILFNKPFQVMCQFTSEAPKANLSDFIDLRGVYPAGRLDYDSEGLVVLTNAGWLQHRIAEPAYKLPKTYLAQVENVPDAAALRRLSLGVELNDGMTRPAEVELVDTPNVWERNPPIRARKSVPASWLKITITEGRNRQVRRMTAAVGHPTLRLIRIAIGPWTLGELQPGQWREVEPRIPLKEDVRE